MPERNQVGLVYNPRIAEAAEYVGGLVRSLKLQDRSWVASTSKLQVSGETLERTSAIITAGGDGTILRVVRLAAPYSVPILGINMGRVGFMTELTVKEAAEKIPSYLHDSPRIEERMMLQATLVRRSGGEPHAKVHALNDVVVGRGAVARLIDIDVAIDGAPLATYRADGVIVATATGSTGYSMSAGGPVLYPEATAMVIQPLAAHMSLQTGLIVPERSVIELGVIGEHEASLTVDGSVDTALGQDDKVVVERSPYVGRFLRAAPLATFYSALTQRLGMKARPKPPEATE
jgi:NAD+ kinase